MDEMKKIWDNVIYKNCEDESDKFLMNLSLGIDAVTTIGGFLLCRKAINRYLEPKGLLEKAGAFGISLAFGGMADFNMAKTMNETIAKRNKEEKENGGDKFTEEQ